MVTRSLLMLALALTLPACAGSLSRAHTSGRVERAVAGGPFAAAPAPPSARCATLDDRHTFWAGVAQGSGLLAGASGIATVPVKDDGARIGLAVGSLVTGALAAFAVSVSSSSSESWTKECAP